MIARVLWAIGLAFAALCSVAAPALGGDHGNLDEGQPLRFEDPYPVPRGEWSLDFGGGSEDMSRGSPGSPREKLQVVFPINVLYGAALNTQLSVGTALSSRTFKDSDSAIESADLRFSVLYNFSQETTTLPALGMKYTLELPTGTRSDGVDTEIKALVTKSVSSVSLHFNLTDRFIGERSFGARSSLLSFDLGASLPLRISRGGRNVLLVGWHSAQDMYSGHENATGFGLGIRRQQTARIVLDAGVETESGNGATDVSLIAGLSWSY